MPEIKTTLTALKQGLRITIGPPVVVRVVAEAAPGSYPVEYRLLNGKGEPIPPTHYRLTMPNGEVKTGESDANGYIRYLDNPHAGKTTLVLLDKGGHPIEILLTDHDDKPVGNKPYRLHLSNGSVLEGTSDADGFIRHPENDHDGEAHLVLPDYT